MNTFFCGYFILTSNFHFIYIGHIIKILEDTEAHTIKKFEFDTYSPSVKQLQLIKYYVNRKFIENSLLNMV